MNVIAESRRLLATVDGFKLRNKQRVMKEARLLRAEVERLRKQLPDARMEMDEFILQSMPVAREYHEAMCKLGQVEARLKGWDAERAAQLEALQRINGQNFEGCITPAIHRFIRERLNQEFRPCEIALMVGCTDGTVSAIGRGTFRLSTKPASVRIGARGHKRNPI